MGVVEPEAEARPDGMPSVRLPAGGTMAFTPVLIPAAPCDCMVDPVLVRIAAMPDAMPRDVVLPGAAAVAAAAVVVVAVEFDDSRSVWADSAGCGGFLSMVVVGPLDKRVEAPAMNKTRVSL